MLVAARLVRFQLTILLLYCTVNSAVIESTTVYPSNVNSNARSGLEQRAPMTSFRQKWKVPVPSQLGQSMDSLTKIVGGIETLPNEFPWQAFLFLEDIQGGMYYACGGSLIGSQWILTAAHCLDNVENAYVFLGMHNISNSEGHVRVYESNRFSVHPNWNPETLHSDIALIRLPVNVTFSDYIRPISFDGSSGNSYTGVKVILTGWGLDSDDSESISEVLRKVVTTVISNDDCRSSYNNLPSTVVCTDGSEKRGACYGDSGGPMNLKLSDGSWKQIGITSFGSSYGCETGYPSAYTRISLFAPWIERTTGISASSSSGGNQRSLLPLIMAIIIFYCRSFT